jgi:hypothetical protein
MAAHFVGRLAHIRDMSCATLRVINPLWLATHTWLIMLQALDQVLNRILLCALLVALPAGAHAAPRSVSVSYNVTLNGARIAILNERFEATADTYHITSDTNAVGAFALLQKRSLNLVSDGRLIKSGLQPHRFEGKRGGDDSRQVAADFDWAGTQLTLTFDGKTETVALPAGTQDRLSIMYQFMFLRYGQISQLDVAMTNGRKLDHYQYTITPGVGLDTPLGRMTTLHLVKQHKPGDTVTEIWLAPQHSFLPVKMLVVEHNGARYEQIVTKLDFKP